MRFMMIAFPKDYLTAKPGCVPELASTEGMRKYNEEFAAAGVLQGVDGLTAPATMSARVTCKNGKSKVTDGPFTEVKEVVGGYWVSEVKSREEALEWASRIPGDDDVTIEVRRCFDISDFTPAVQDRLTDLEEQQAAKFGNKQGQ
jgi:hypothetical protein